MISNSLIAHKEPKSPASEAYRMIRTNLEYTSVDTEKKTILFTSSLEKEGKTTTLSNVAITLAHSGSRVIVIDADLRKPRLYKLFKVKKQPGLTNYLAKDIPLSDVIQQETGIKDLNIIAAGPIPPLASELVASQKMRILLEELKKSYDYILIDSPPILSVTDAGILAGRVDGTILCVAQGETHVDAVKTAVKGLRKVNANLLGAVMTKAERRGKGYYAYHYYSYEYEQKSGPKGWLQKLRFLRHRV
jgi:capsular exopolysaccharide synthesis family protein